MGTEVQGGRWYCGDAVKPAQRNTSIHLYIRTAHSIPSFSDESVIFFGMHPALLLICSYLCLYNNSFISNQIKSAIMNDKELSETPFFFLYFCFCFSLGSKKRDFCHSVDSSNALPHRFNKKFCTWKSMGKAKDTCWYPWKSDSTSKVSTRRLKLMRGVPWAP